MNARILLPLALLLVGCNDEDETGLDDTSPPEDTGPFGFTVKGTAMNLMPPQAAHEGLCVHAADPTDALSGGELDILGSGTVGAGGAYEIPGIITDSTVGLLMLVQDCNDEGTVMPTATGMSASTYASLEGGDVISDYVVYSVDMGTKATFQKGLGAAGYTGDLTQEGALLGFVLDATGNPVGDAMVSGPKGTTTYY
ncbi:MAG: hypothetical protein JXB39_07970, partial [Deltaproteobacteria bacterium]|nr:hypothetical protein [Deltaproteobacteria bacterium]